MVPQWRIEPGCSSPCQEALGCCKCFTSLSDFNYLDPCVHLSAFLIEKTSSSRKVVRYVRIMVDEAFEMELFLKTVFLYYWYVLNCTNANIEEKRQSTRHESVISVQPVSKLLDRFFSHKIKVEMLKILIKFRVLVLTESFFHQFIRAKTSHETPNT